MPTQREQNTLPCIDGATTPDDHKIFTIKLVWDGTTYLDFQFQPSNNAVQDQLEHCLRNLFRWSIRMLVWGQTYAGKKANSLCASCK